MIEEETSQTLREVLDCSEESTSLVKEIADASETQTMAIQQITQGVDQISAVVQTNSATAEESAAASGELSIQADKLKNLVLQFKMEEIDHGSSLPETAPQKSFTGSSEFDSKY